MEIYLEYMGRLPQGTPVFQKLDHLKDCKSPGLRHAYAFQGGTVCPGCKQLCRIEASRGVERGDAIFIQQHDDPIQGLEK